MAQRRMQIQHHRVSVTSGRLRRWQVLALALLAAAVVWLALSRARSNRSIARSEIAPESVQRREVRAARARVPGSPAGFQPEMASAAVAAAEAHPEAAPPPLPVQRRWHPRDPQEWQGMLVDIDALPPCESSATCGLARACKQGLCKACEFDADCGSGEACVLDHCVARENVACRRRADCASGSLCILSGYSAEARGNEGMRSLCLNPASGASFVPAAEPEDKPDPRKVLPDDDLLEQARAAAREADQTAQPPPSR